MNSEDEIERLRASIKKRKQAWLQWHEKNPEIWIAFEKFSSEAARSGRGKYSHWAVMNRVRWHTDIETTGSQFKISNNFITFYARAFCAKYPAHREFFNFKPLIEERKIRELLIKMES